VHNVRNALAAITVALELGVPVASIQAALRGFAGIARRFQAREVCRTAAGDIMLIDDYGHHPSEIAATLQAVRDGWPGRRLVLAFQPHRYSRTQDAFDDFVAVLSQADVLVLAEVYAAGEQANPLADGRALSRAVRMRGQVDPVFVEDMADLPGVLRGMVRADDILVTMGAGSIGQVAAQLPGSLCE
jgi:UDP-N-acetylmuramate--alanine ligase